MGGSGLNRCSELAVLNANYLKKKLNREYSVPYDGWCKHEFVLSAKPLKESCGITALDIAKRLFDYGVHPPTVYFPLIVPEALMIEPTETESKDSLDAFVSVMISIYREAQENPEILKQAPCTAVVGRIDEVRAVKTPLVRWQKSSKT